MRWDSNTDKATTLYYLLFCQISKNSNTCSSSFDLVAVQDVINVSKKYLPGMAKGFFDSKLTLHVGDGFEFMKQNQDAFDIIITDSSDPVGKFLHFKQGYTVFLCKLLLVFYSEFCYFF